MPVAQISNPYGAYGQAPGPGAGLSGCVFVEAQTRSTALDPGSAGSTDGNFREIKAGHAVTTLFAASSFYSVGTYVVNAATGVNQLVLGVAAENIDAFAGSTGSTGAVKRQSPQQPVGAIITYGIAYAMFCATDNPGAGVVALPAYVMIATTSQSAFNASCHFGLCALSSSTVGVVGQSGNGVAGGSSAPTSMTLVGIAYTSLGAVNSVVGVATSPQLYPIMVKQGA